MLRNGIENYGPQLVYSVTGVIGVIGLEPQKGMEHTAEV